MSERLATLKWRVKLLEMRAAQAEAREKRLYAMLAGCAQFVREEASHGSVDYEVSGRIMEELHEMFVGEGTPVDTPKPTAMPTRESFRQAAARRRKEEDGWR